MGEMGGGKRGSRIYVKEWEDRGRGRVGDGGQRLDYKG